MKDIYAQIGERVHMLRKRSRITQAKLAEKAGLSDNYVGQIERGEAKPTLDILKKLARALGASFSALFQFPEDQPRSVSQAVKRLSKDLERRDVQDAEFILQIAERVAEYVAKKPRRGSSPKGN